MRKLLFLMLPLLAASITACGGGDDGEGGSHEKWTSGEQKIPVPRHTEINEYTAEAIVKTAQTNPGVKRKERT